MTEPMITRLRHGFCLQKEKYQKKRLIYLYIEVYTIDIV